MSKSNRPPTDFEPWHFSDRDLIYLETKIKSQPIPPRIEVTFAKAFDDMARLLRKHKTLDDIRHRLPKTELERPWTTEEKYEFYDATEAFFQTFYASISAIASVVARHESVFGKAPIENMTRFIGWLESRYKLDHFAVAMQMARSFRAMLDHPQSFQPYTWAFGYGGVPAHIFLYGSPSLLGRIPDGAASATEAFYSVMPDGNWSRTAPDDATVMDVLGFFFFLIISEIVGDPVGILGRATEKGTLGMITFSPSRGDLAVPTQLSYRWPPVGPDTPGFERRSTEGSTGTLPVGHALLNPSLDALGRMSPILFEQFGKDNDMRALVLSTLVNELPDGVAAFDELAQLLRDLESYAADEDDSPGLEIASRLRMDFHELLDALAACRSWRIMDVCADLMELGLLVRKFQNSPEGVLTWRTASDQERRAQFEFKKLLTEIPEGEELPFIGRSREKNLSEYIAHIRSREIAMWTTHPSELSRSENPVTPDSCLPWLRVMSVEIIRHVGAAAFALLMWSFSDYPADAELPFDIKMVEPEGTLSAYLDNQYKFIDEHVKRDLFDDLQSKYSEGGRESKP